MYNMYMAFASPEKCWGSPVDTRELSMLLVLAAQPSELTYNKVDAMG